MAKRQWELVANPDWAGLSIPTTPFPASACHDLSHFITVQCRCGERMHMHESAVKDVPSDVGIASRCKRCKRIMKFPPSYFAGAFAELRRLGWIA
jgi:bacterioferritin-associated ferredoxin